MLCCAQQTDVHRIGLWFVFYLGDEQILIDTMKYDRQIVRPIPSLSAGPA